MAPQPLRFQRPVFPNVEDVERYMRAAREQRWFSNSGPCWHLLCERLAGLTGVRAVPVSSGTMALITAIAALRKRTARGASLALVPSFTFAAGPLAIQWNGLEPVFLDVDPSHFHLDPQELDQALKRLDGRVALVVAGSSFGTPPPPEVRSAWEQLCRNAGVPLLVDSAAGLGARGRDGVAVGAQGDAEIVSFHATKPVAAGEGGAVLTRDAELVAEIERLTNFGFDEDGDVHDARGLNGKLSELSAATVLAALDRLPAALAARRAHADQMLARLDSMRAQAGAAVGTWQFVPLLASDRAVRDAVLRAAAGRVSVRTYYRPLHQMPGFAQAACIGELPGTRELADRIVCLPMAEDLTDAEIDLVTACVDAGLRNVSPSRVGM
jgi:dTDP-4-amino-4,6-dideoxygalactose transaminase